MVEKLTKTLLPERYIVHASLIFLAVLLLKSPFYRRSGLLLEKLGSDYRGWVVPTDIIHPGMVCYRGGVGEDISFDLALINRFGCTVHVFDPTPRSIAYVDRFAPKENFYFYPFGL